MKRILIAASLLLGLAGCIAATHHQPLDFTKPVVITDVQSFKDGPEMGSTIKYLYHAMPTSSIQNTINADKGWFVDSISRFKIGDTVILQKK